MPKNDSWYFDSSIYEGGQMIRVPIPLTEEMPLIVKAGSAIPMDDENTVFTVYPIENGTFVSDFFTDDGLTYGYINNDCVKLGFTVICDEDTVAVTYKNTGNSPFSPTIRLCLQDSRKLIVT